jgi:hypothetical protein
MLKYDHHTLSMILYAKRAIAPSGLRPSIAVSKYHDQYLLYTQFAK